MHTTVRFLLAGQVEEVHDCDPTRTVLEFLREEKGLTGTKEGCAEGDCGACTVVVGELHEGTIHYRAVNSCIQFLPTLDGKQLVTVEDLSQSASTSSGELHAVQQAMVDQHGSQCGFCTPGFVMSLFSMFHDNPGQDTSRANINLGLAGNLCRCTGYAPIVRAAEQSLRAGRRDQFTDTVKQTRELLQSIQPTETLHTSFGKRQFHAPHSTDELCSLLQDNPEAVLIAGATDVGLWVNKQMQRPDTLVYLGQVAELQVLEDDGATLCIGAGVSYADSMQAIASRYPAFLPLIERIGSTQVRNAGTVGGNIANGSPIGDMPPGLIAAGAKLALRGSRGRRVIELEDFFIAYGQQDLRKGEFVEQILLPVPQKDQIFATYKVSKRTEQDISAVCGAFSLHIEEGIITDARVCYGGMAEIPKRANACEAVLNGKPWVQEAIEAAMQTLQEDFTPISDMRASAQYRMQVAQNMLQRFYLEHSSKPYPTGFEQGHANG